MPTERIAILVDGSNLYHYLRELKLTGLAEFDYKVFAHRPSFGLMKNVDLTTTLRREDLAGFLKKP